MKKQYLRKNARREGSKGQAVVEMALILPLMIIMIVNFIAVMVLVVYQQKLEAGANIAATSVLSVPLGQSGSATTAYQGSFAGTFQAPSFIQETNGTVVVNGQAVNLSNGIGCSGLYFSGQVNYSTSSGVFCVAQAKLDFKKTPLGFAVFWNPTLNVNVLVFPSPVRQCLNNLHPTSTTQC